MLSFLIVVVLTLIALCGGILLGNKYQNESIINACLVTSMGVIFGILVMLVTVAVAYPAIQ